jgi:hypothetical protein
MSGMTQATVHVCWQIPAIVYMWWLLPATVRKGRMILADVHMGWLVLVIAILPTGVADIANEYVVIDLSYWQYVVTDPSSSVD